MKFCTTLFLRSSLLVALCILVGLSRPSSAQPVSGYTMSTFSGSYTSLTSSGGTQLFTLNDDASSSFTAPFAFTYDTKNFSSGVTIGVSSNGFLAWGSTVSAVPNSSQYGWADGVAYAICPINSDLVSYVYYQTQGSAPNRKLVVEWYQYYIWPSSSTSMVQMQAYEGTNVIEFLYFNHSFNYSNSFGSDPPYIRIGLNGGTPSTDNKMYTVSGTSTPPTDLRFTPIPPINVQLGVTPQPHQYNFGSLGTGAVATTAITVTNVGDNSAGTAKLSIINVGITGDPDYTIVSKPASSDSILVGDSRQIVVRFSPIIDGIRTAGITIASNGKDSAVQNFAFTGIGLAPLISVDTNVLFKNKFVKMGDSLVARILISSTNTPTLFMTGYQFVGLDSGEYRISRYPSSNTIPGGTTDSIFITYKPTKEGRHVATLNLLNNSINNPVLPITLYGTAILPHIIVTPNPLRFDSVLMGVDSCKSIRIYNPGTDTLLIKANGLISNDGDFHYTPLTGLDTMIPPDKFKDVTICFKPLQKGTRVARLRFLTNIPKTFEQIPRDTAGQFLVDISGTGVPSSTLGQSIGFGEPSGWMDSVLIGKTICTDDSLTNTGDADLLINTITITGSNGAEYTYNGITLPFLLKAKSKIVIHLCATPGARGVRNGTLEIAGTMNEKPFTSKATLAVTGLLACAQASPNGLFLNTLIPISDSAVGMITLCDTVTNCGDIAAIYTATIGGNNAADYTVAPASSQTVLPGGTAVFCVTYKPTVSGNSPATLKISAADTPDQTVTLSGTAGCSELSAVIGGDSGPFGKGGHYTITVTITNNGNFDWVPDSGNPFLIGVDAGLLTQTGGTLDTIHPGGNVQLTFDFHPQDTMKAFSIPVGFVGGPCRDTTGVLLSGTTTNSGVRELSLQGFFLGMNHPNPFANATQFTYSTPTEASVTLSLHDVTGKLIRIISSGPVSAGEHTVVFNAGELSSGTYLLMLESGNIQLTHQVVIAK